MTNKNLYAILMAGGVGLRFWPVSTTEFPKQFHDMLGTGETLIQKTFSRLKKIIPAENILILTNEKYNNLVLEQLPEVTTDNIILEPAMRNTAPCILYASLKIKKTNPEALVLVAPSDHWIEDEDLFINHLKESFNYCHENDVLMTLGIQPTFPNTGYGYIEYNTQDTQNIKKVIQFREKPNYQTAKEFIAKGNFLWNAGIFVWSVKSVLEKFSKHQAEMYELFNQGSNVLNTPDEKEFITNTYPKAENISIDYAILEKANNVFVLPSSFDWNDLGTWGSLYDKLPKNENNNAIVNAKVIEENASGNIIRTSTGKTVVINGLNDFIVVENNDYIVIYPKDKEQDIKKVAEQLQ